MGIGYSKNEQREVMLFKYLIVEYFKFTNIQWCDVIKYQKLKYFGIFKQKYFNI